MGEREMVEPERKEELEVEEQAIKEPREQKMKGPVDSVHWTPAGLCLARSVCCRNPESNIVNMCEVGDLYLFCFRGASCHGRRWRRQAG